jgi:hypothetical protein
MNYRLTFLAYMLLLPLIRGEEISNVGGHGDITPNGSQPIRAETNQTPSAAESDGLTGFPSPNDVFVIAIERHHEDLKDYFTPESLLQALPKLVPAEVLLPVGDKIFWQSGVIVLKDKTVLFWRTCGDWFIAVDRAEGTSFYAMPKNGSRPVSEESSPASPAVAAFGLAHAGTNVETNAETMIKTHNEDPRGDPRIKTALTTLHKLTGPNMASNRVPPSKYSLSIARVYDPSRSQPEWVFILGGTGLIRGGETVCKSVGALKKLLAGLPRDSILDWHPSCGGEAEVLQEDIEDLKATCHKAGVMFTIHPSG